VAQDSDTDWTRITALYTVLAHVAPSPVVDLNRAVALGRSHGPARGLAVVDGLTTAGNLTGYPQLSAVRADLLELAGRSDEAAAAYRQAAELSRNQGERHLFLARAAGLEAD
jgi:predicted RNA polymerase sigma factor